jgi:beta-lactamase class A
MDGVRPLRDWKAAVRRAFRQANLRGSVLAVDVDRGTEAGYNADAVWPSASVGKVAVLVALMRAIAAGEGSLDERVHVPATGRTPGPTGLSVMAHDVDLSLRDVALLMIAVSDNHATDVLLGRVPPERVTAAMRELGLGITTLEITIAEMYARAAARMAGVTSFEEAIPLLRTDPDIHAPTAPWRTTAREIASLLGQIWRDQAAPAGLCAEMRSLLRACATSNGLPAAFPRSVGATLGHKTGTLASVWNDVGVVEYPDGSRYAVAVFSHGDPGDASRTELVWGRAIAAAARLAVEQVRTARAAQVAAS